MINKITYSIILSCTCAMHANSLLMSSPFASLFRHPFGEYSIQNFRQKHPINISEDATHFTLEIEVPGYDKKDITIEILNNGRVISIAGVRKNALEDTNEETKYIRKEISQQFSYSEYLHQPVTTENADAKLENGILTIILQKAAPSKDCCIDIK